MKNIKEVIANILLVFVLFYLPFAFIINDFNPLKWDTIWRALYVLALISFFTFAYKQYYKK